jgi:hypothetical protein
MRRYLFLSICMWVTSSVAMDRFNHNNHTMGNATHKEILFFNACITGNKTMIENEILPLSRPLSPEISNYILFNVVGHSTTKSDFPAIVELLIDLGANSNALIDFEEKQYLPILAIATERALLMNNTAVVETLINKGANPYLVWQDHGYSLYEMYSFLAINSKAQSQHLKGIVAILKCFFKSQHTLFQ